MVRNAGAADADEQIGLAAVKRTFADRFRSWRKRHSFSLGLTVLIFVFLIALAIPRSIVNVSAGHVGVLWKRFEGGTVIDRFLDEGIHLIFPWDRAYVYDARLRTIVHTYDTISSNGLSMQVEISTRYRINRASVGTLHKKIGPNYPDVLLNPEIGSNAREVISRYTPEQLYSDARAFIQAQILERMVTQLGSSLISQSPSGQLVYVEDTLIRSVALPSPVVDAIERKAQQYHIMLEYDFRIERERLERTRKQIEAQGIREFQDIVSDSITDEYLRLRGIDATLAISTSNNSKIVVMGGSDGLPVILNTGEFEGGGSNAGPVSLENITDPPLPNAARPETGLSNSVQPDAHLLQPSGSLTTNPINNSNALPDTAKSGPRLITSETEDTGTKDTGSDTATMQGFAPTDPTLYEDTNIDAASGLQTLPDGLSGGGATQNAVKPVTRP